MPGTGMRGGRKAAVAALCAAWMATSASAQAIYRCGGDPRHLSDRPCAVGDRAIDFAVDRPDAERQRQATEVAAREARLAEQLRGNRKAREAAAVDGASGFGATAQKEPDAEKPRPKKPKTVPVSAQKKKRLKAPAAPGAAGQLKSS
jgi:hypothetical protein